MLLQNVNFLRNFFSPHATIYMLVSILWQEIANMYKSDQEMIEGAVKGDAIAFGFLIQKHYDTVYGLAFHHLRNFDDAQDIAQDVFVEVFQSLKHLRDSSKFRAWLRSITLNLCKMRLRSRKEMIPLDLIGDDIQLHHSSLPDPAEEYEKRELQDSLMKAIEFLSDNNRLVLRLYYMDGMSYKEIASFLSVPKSTVKGRMHRAVNQLREEMMDMAKGAFSYKRRRDSGSVLADHVIIDPKTGARYTKIKSVKGKNDIIFTNRYPHEIDLSPNGKFMLSSGLVVPLDGAECFELVDMPTVCCKYSPDGKKVVFFSKGAIWMIHVSPETGRPIDEPKQIFGSEYKSIYPIISWSPDSEKIAFPRTAEHELNRIWTLSINDGQLTKIADYPVRGFHNPAWSPDGKYIAYYGGNYEEGRTLRISPAEGGTSEIVLDIERDNLNSVPFWSYDSKWLFHYMLDWKIKAVRISDGCEIDITPPGEVSYLLSRSASKMIFFNQSYDYKEAIKLISASGGEPCELGKDLTLLSEDMFWSSDGKMIITQGEDNDGELVFWMLPISGAKPFQLKIKDLPDKAVPCSISPDGQKVLCSVKPDKNSEDLWVVLVSIDGKVNGHSVQIFKGHDPMYKWNGMYQWSPDSTRIAVYKDGIYIAKADGSRPIQITTGDPRRGRNTSYKWSPDGTMIAFIPYSRKLFELWIMPSMGSEPRKIMDIGDRYFAWTPDSKEIALFDEDGRLVIASINSGIIRKVFHIENYGIDDLGHFCWSPDGQYLAFIGYKYEHEKPPQIYTITSEGDAVKQITNDEIYDSNRSLSSLHWSPDGKWIAYGLNGFVKTRPECSFWEVEVEELLRESGKNNHKV